MTHPYLVALALAGITFSGPVRGADATSPPGPSGFRGDLLLSLARLEQQTLSLEQAMPQAKFSWRPAKGVRSVSELYLHIAGGIYFLASKLGREVPPDVQAIMKANKWESQTTKKEEISRVLTSAFAYLRNVILDTRDEDLDKKVQLMGNEVSTRLALMATQFHSWEHLGQAIAYARSNGVVPPWNKGEDKH
ncbi:MAG TPA: DinB family protein [Anaeromyxobacteraceae bacterium]|nr:DinB family protein [Anaeromyxobacteraceae bacterium]